jgi:hypothetical protein
MIFKKKTGITAPIAGACRLDWRTQVVLSSAAVPAVAPGRREVIEALTGQLIKIVSIAEKNRRIRTRKIVDIDKPIGPAALPPKDRQTVRFLVYFLCNVCTFVDVCI